MASRPFQPRQSQPPPVPDLSGTKKRVTFVHNQYNSPLGLYSPAEVADTLNRHTRLLDNGAVGIDFALLAAPNLARSEVYKMLNEEEKPTSPSYVSDHQEQFNCTTLSADNNKKRVAWPPVETNISNNGDEICQSIEAPFLQQKLPARHQLAAVSASKAAPPVPPKPANPIINPKDFDGKLSPSTVTQNYSSKPEPLKRQILVGRPLVSEPLKPSQPKTQIKYGACKTGNVNWPPKTNMCQEELGASSQTGAFRCQTRDYQEFFNQHQLQPTYPAYRAPPGTQRVAGAKNM